jgi:amino acid adenylation domain-containing protein
MILKSHIQPARQSSNEHPLSWFQERLWLINQKQPNDLSYNIPVSFLIEGALDVAALNQSLGAIINRHQSLCTRFVTTARGEPVQTISPEADFCLPVVATRSDEISRHFEEHLKHTFDLSSGPVIVAKLLRLDPQKHVLLLNVHHIVADGWSIEGILFSELHKCYQAYCENKQPVLAPLGLQYVDFAYWQRQQDFSAALAYWQGNLANYEDSLEMPTDFPRRPQPGKRSAAFVYRYPSEFSTSLGLFSQTHRCTLFMVLLAGFGLVVNRYTGKDDICLGTTTSGRTLPGLEGLIGFFINILPLRIQIDEELCVAEYIEAVRKLILSGFDHQLVPFERILYSLGLGSSGKSNALVPLVLRHHNFPRTKMADSLPGGVKFSPYPDDGADAGPTAPIRSELTAARCEIELSYTGDADNLKVEVIYASDLYRRETIERLLAQHENLLRGMFAANSRRLRDLPLLSEADIGRLCAQDNHTLRTPTASDNFVTRFDFRVTQSPNDIACYDQQGASSYRQIASQANRLAHALIAQGVAAGDVVGVCLDRGAPLLVSLLAIWKAGAAYVPLDPSYPDAYLRQIVKDVAPKQAISSASYQAKLGMPETQCFVLDQQQVTWTAYPDSPPSVALMPDTLAYVMYTSGSTGTPKGVRIPHRQLTHWLACTEANWPFEAGEVVGQKTTVAFAVSIKELFAGLLNGCAQVFLDTKTVQDTSAFVAALAQYRVSRIHLVPSHLEAVLRHLRNEGLALPALKMCIAAGEPLTAEVVVQFRELLPNTRLLNNYGCTELNDVTYYDTQGFVGQQGFVPIGKPIQNTQLFVLDRKGRLVPEGVAGELHVASGGMSDGYHNLPLLTQERYLKNIFSEDTSSRLYNTGDVVKYLSDGNLEYIGRWDTQVKVRGFRVDVRQVEKVLGEYPGIGARAVVGDGGQLLAYYVEQQAHRLDLNALREFLQERLPEYMVPSSFVCVAAMPRLPNGKLDRRALRPALGVLQHSDVYEAPNTETERTLAAIWSEVLEIPDDEIGRQTHFFEIGGHSLSATRVVARIKERMQADIGLSLAFEHPRLADLSEQVVRVRQNGSCEDENARDWPHRLGHSSSRPNRVPGLLENKVVLVTGSSRGIGSATVRLLASQGAIVAINYVQSEARANKVRERIVEEGGTAETFQADVTDVNQVAQLVAEVRARFGPIDVLVANAAIGFKIQPFVKYNWDDFERKVTDEIKSIFYLCQAVVPEMVERKSGSIVAVSSSMSKVSTNGYIAHSTAKAALDSFVRALAGELGPDGIRVNTVAPGLTLTDATAIVTHQQRDAAAARCPLRRNGLPRDVAGAVLFLASDLSQFMTGTYLPVDGGYTML